jgi:isocitrate lyase
MAGSNLGDDHKTFFSGSLALKAGGVKNTANQFEVEQEVPTVEGVPSYSH